MIIPYLRKYDDKKILSDVSIEWDDSYAVPTAYVMTNLQYGFSFNILPFSEMFYESE